MVKVVYDGGRQQHPNSTYEVYAEVRTAYSQGREISDATAQAIASWWHWAGCPNTTWLSTMGQVTDDMSLSDFVTPEEYRAANEQDQLCLDMLGTYIIDRQRGDHEDNPEWWQDFRRLVCRYGLETARKLYHPPDRMDLHHASADEYCNIVGCEICAES